VARKQIPIGMDLFFNDDISTQLSRRQSAVPNGLPSRVDGTRNRPPRKSMIRPRIVTETFRSPITTSRRPSGLSSATPSSLPTPLVRASRRWSQLRKMPIVPPSSRARHFSSSSPSSDESQTRETEFFTPPTTQRDKGKMPVRFASRRTTQAALPDHDPAVEPSLASLDSSTSLFSHTSPSSVTDTPRQRCIPSFAPNDPHRQNTVEAPNTPTPSSIYSQSSNPTLANATTNPQALRTNTSTPAWLTSPSSSAQIASRTLRTPRALDVPGSSSPTSLYSTGMLDGRSSSRLFSSAWAASEMPRRPLGVDEKLWNNVVWLRRDVEGSQREVEGLKGEMRGLLERR
jgi:hypothetical protein